MWNGASYFPKMSLKAYIQTLGYYTNQGHLMCNKLCAP